MRQAIYPGSFNPWHEGHTDILNKALEVFDTVFVAIGRNPDKKESNITVNVPMVKGVVVWYFDGFLVDFIHSVNTPIDAIVRGLRNGRDLEDERVQQYYNEDLAKESGFHLPPTVYFLADRNLVHISSSAARAVEKIKRSTSVTQPNDTICKCGVKKS